MDLSKERSSSAAYVNTSSLKDRTIVITGASRGIGRAIARRCAKDGANVVVAAKTVDPHPKLPGTIHTVAEEVEQEGGRALPVQVDVRNAEQVRHVMDASVSAFGHIDALVNNAGAISLTQVKKTDLKRYDLMQDVNARAVFVCSKAALPYLKKARNPHILSLSPPLSMDSKWLVGHAPYTLSKFGMTMLTLGMAEELREDGIAVNSLWPRTTIATAAIEFAVGNRALFQVSRTPEIVADAAHRVLTTEGLTLTGKALIDEDFLREQGVSDFDDYAYDAHHCGKLQTDLFVE